ncbi:hypothetical protein EYF80_001511 [Liparis tanakae]|uniref:Uncharacterized protein n=1 Tax=Liparis tanakae TaxID=230148 RepID=A0A4Z2JDD5_9TELE|nr:hypothetical protein EYF80_001511 [Liparis tanakae]
MSVGRDKWGLPIVLSIGVNNRSIVPFMNKDRVLGACGTLPPVDTGVPSLYWRHSRVIWGSTAEGNA